MAIQSIGKTAVTSKVGTAKSIDISKISRTYEHELSNIEGCVRVDLPNTYVTLLGLRQLDYTLLYFHEDKIIVDNTVYEDDAEFKRVPLYWYTNNRNPKTEDFDVDEDNKFFILSEDLCPFKVGDNIEFQYIKDTEDYHRHIVIQCKQS